MSLEHQTEENTSCRSVALQITPMSYAWGRFTFAYFIGPIQRAKSLPESQDDVQIEDLLQTYGAGVWSTLALMGVSAVCASATDLAFNLNGYLWQLVNCLFTAGYSLYLRGVMDKVIPLYVPRTCLCFLASQKRRSHCCQQLLWHHY